MTNTLNPKLSEPMFSTRQIFSLLIPVFFDAVLFMIVGIVDSVMVASAGSEAVSAVSLMDTISSFFLLVQNSLAAGGGIVVAQYIGKRDYENARCAAKQTVYVSTLYTTAIMVLLLVFLSPMIKLVYGDLEPTLLSNCESYLFWILLGFPVYAIGNSCATMLRAQANTKLALYIAGTVNILNAIGNAILIYGFDMGVSGAAISTSFSRLVYCVLGILTLKNREAPVFLENLRKIRFKKDMLKKVLRIGVGNGIEGGLTQLGSILLSMMLSSLGAASVAVYSIACKLCSIGWALLSALDVVLMTVAGQCIGAGEREQAKMYVKKFMRYAAIAVMGFFSFILLFRNYAVLIYDLDENMLAECAKQMAYAAIITMLTFYARAVIPFAAFRAAGDTRYSVISGITGMFAGRVLFGYIFAIVLDMGVLGMWIGMGMNHLICALSAHIRLKNGRWLEKKVI